MAIVDDSSVVRGLFTRWLGALPDIEIVGVHRNGAEAVQAIGHLKPDVLLLDIEMPEMDGLTALPLLRQKSPETRILVVSGVSLRGADITLRCLMRGATHYLPKPSTMREVSISLDFRSLLLSQVREIGSRPVAQRQSAPSPVRPTVSPVASHPASATSQTVTLRHGAIETSREVSARLCAPSAKAPELLVIGASTGGPPAVAKFIAGIMPDYADVPVVVAQHMPPAFTMLFADHLRRQFGFDAVEIAGGEDLAPGRIHICRGGQNLGIQRSGDGFRAFVPYARPEIRWRPSVNLLFETAAVACGPATLGVILTGMGDDGATGARTIAAAGGTVLAQDENTSVVWGMPGAAFRAGVCSALKPLEELARYACILKSGPGR